MQELIELLENGVTQFHVVKACKDKLLAAGYEELDWDSEWNMKTNTRYMVSPFRSVLFAFYTGSLDGTLRSAACHTDFPMLKLKTRPGIQKKNYLQVNVEPYGGLILNTWFDRPLGLAGKVVLKSEDPFAPEVRLFDSKKPLFIIPNLAPHLKKDAKEAMDVQKEVVPIYMIENKGKEVSKAILFEYIAKSLSVDIDSIIDYDLYLYITAKPELVGLEENLLASPRIDNISSAAALLNALCSKDLSGDATLLGAFFDNEEIGSRSKQGADSTLLANLTTRLFNDKLKLTKSFNISMDVAHGTHPNYTEKSDISNDILLGLGFAIKTSASQRYVTDSEASAVLAAICEKNKIGFQRQVNRSGAPGGQTLGPIMASYLPIKSADIGIPVLAMHSSCELIHMDDYYALRALINAYFHC